MKQIKLLSLMAIIVVMFSNCTRIDAGHVGLKVNLYGDEKGVDDVTEVTGRVWYNPATTEIYEFPTFVQDANHALNIATDDGLTVGINSGLNYKVDPTRVPEIFKEYRLTLRQLEEGILLKRVRKAWSAAMDEYTAEECYSKKEEIRQKAASYLEGDLEDMGFILESLVYNDDPVLPQSVRRNIEAKVNATQISLQKQAELEQVKADAEKAKEKALADKQVSITQAQGIAEANRIVNSSLTRELIEYEKVKRWDGHMPKVTGDAGMLIQMESK